MFGIKALRRDRDEAVAQAAELNDALTAVEGQNYTLRALLGKAASIYENGSPPMSDNQNKALYGALTAGREFLTATA